MSCTIYDSGFVEYTIPSAAPALGEVNTSSVGILGLKILPFKVFSLPPANTPSGKSSTVKSVPFALLYSKYFKPKALR